MLFSLVYAVIRFLFDLVIIRSHGEAAAQLGSCWLYGGKKYVLLGRLGLVVSAGSAVQEGALGHLHTL